MSDKKNMTKEYSNGEVTIVWKPDLCIHSENCFHGLPEVFNPNNRPWIKAEEASSEQIIAQVKKCPSGALSFYKNEDGKAEESTASASQRVEVMKNGPLMVHGNITVNYPDGKTEQKEKRAAFCRCGASGNKPFCDGSHRKVGFEG